MFRTIVHKYQAVFVFALLIVIMGLISYVSLPRESAPEIRRPLIFVTTTYPGVSASDIESLITKEIEAELEGVTGLDKITSDSSQGLSQVKAEFTGDTEVEVALRRIRDRVETAKADLPEDADEPQVKELNFSDQPILIINISNPEGLAILDPAVEYFEEEIGKIPGVLDVNVSGQLEKEVAVELDPSSLKHYGLSVSDISRAIQNENVTIPGGELKNRVRRYSLSVSGEIENPRMFGEIAVHKKGRSVKLKNLGHVAFTYADPDTINRMNGEPSVSLAVTKRSGENLIRIADEIKALLNEHGDVLPSGSNVAFSFDQSEDIRQMVKDLENNILSGLLLVLIVTLFFLGPINATFVSLGIPFSMLISFFVLDIFGITLNMVVLFSLVLSLGMLVDNGIVIVENIYRHRALGESRREAAIFGVKEVAMPITTSTVTTILAFFPIIFMPGIMGEFMGYLPKTVIIVLSSSLLVGLTITTVFCSRFLRINSHTMNKMTDGTTGFQKTQTQYQDFLKRIIVRPLTVVIACLVIVTGGILLKSFFGSESIFFPKLDPRTALVNITAAPGTPLHETNTIAKKTASIVPTVPSSIETIQTTVGQSGGRGGGRPKPHEANIRVGFKPWDKREILGKTTIAALKDEFETFAPAEIEVEELRQGPPSGHDISYQITGRDYTVLGEISREISDIIQKHDAVLETIDSDFETVKPEIFIDIDRQKASIFGLDTRTVATQLRSAINGSKVSTFRQGKEEHDVVVRYRKDARNDLSALRELQIVGEDERVALGSIATINHTSTLEMIKRHERKRAVEVWADFKGGVDRKESIKKKIEAKVAGLDLPPGYSIGAGEGQDVRNESQTFLVKAFFLALLLIFLVMVLQFNSVTQPLIILISVYLSIGGVFWGLFLSQMTFVVIMSGIGTISLAGVVVNNAIVMIDFMNQLRREGYEDLDAVIIGARTRLRPVLLTAITTITGLLPMALGFSLDFHNLAINLSSQSSEWWSPMAWAVIFGLTCATFFTLFVVPSLVYFDFTKQERWEKIKRYAREKSKYSRPEDDLGGSPGAPL